MKSLARLILAVVAVPAIALAQGTIDFHNPSTFPLRVYDAAGNLHIVGAAGSPLGPASVRVGLFIGPNGTSSIFQMTMVGLTTNSASTVPLFLGTFNGGNPYTVAPSTPNAQVSFAFGVWSISTGAFTLQDALLSSSGYVAVSAIGHGYPLGGFGTPPSLPPPTFGTPTAAQPWLVGGIILGVPEPSTTILGIAGAAALWVIRRRK